MEGHVSRRWRTYGCLADFSVTRLPVIYVFGRRNIDIEGLTTQFKAAVSDTESDILLMCDTVYAHSLGILFYPTCLT
jgi:diphthamide biosynthesis enzyme Dph1/Dph2-like protein